FIPKPPIFIPLTEVIAITLSRAGSGAAASATKTFDMTFQLKGNTEHQFSNVNREEQTPLEDYFKNKNIKVRNDLDEDSSALMAAVLDAEISDGDSSEDDRPNIRSPGAVGANDEDDSVDDDFQGESESDIAEEYDSEANPSTNGDEMDEE
ncbi:FACT complex subunit pob3, partial [Neolecta irregularis DAH-3]